MWLDNPSLGLALLFQLFNYVSDEPVLVHECFAKLDARIELLKLNKSFDDSHLADFLLNENFGRANKPLYYLQIHSRLVALENFLLFSSPLCHLFLGKLEVLADGNEILLQDL
jgi:hypothetical protein